MAILEILTFPHPNLRKKSKPVEAGDSSIEELVENMTETMYESHGIGLAAPQINVQKRVVVIDTRPKEDGRYTIEGLTELEQKVEQPLILINPEVTEKEGETTYDEGCLSVPSYFETVTRFENITVKTLNLKGETIEFHVDGLLAIAIQHEIDHLDGKLFIDRLSVIKGNRIKAKIKKFGYPDPEEDEDEEDHTDHNL
ncbi:MAG: peptide deformylase [Bdellovibrionaceae bacterium]|jgi:peptide deformylase|nr:peptide deformylase [Pseudobdellovibrionaceae bacterium]